MNERHALIDNFGGTAKIASYELSPEGKRQWVFQSKNDFFLIHSNKWVMLQIEGQVRAMPRAKWWLTILHDAKVPRSITGKPNKFFTRTLLVFAREFHQLLRDLTDVSLKNFLTDEERIGAVCEKRRSAGQNGWSFPPLEEARAAWEEKYGPVSWDVPAEGMVAMIVDRIESRTADCEAN